jgi:hypothetical protein
MILLRHCNKAMLKVMLKVISSAASQSNIKGRVVGLCYWAMHMVMLGG